MPKPVATRATGYDEFISENFGPALKSPEAVNAVKILVKHYLCRPKGMAKTVKT